MGALRTTPEGRRISYAQNGEDIVLLRVLKDRPTGRWIDVGANHPENDSVTKNFSDMGWTGINIEPVQPLYDLLAAHRPNDVNIHAAASDRPGTTVFHQNDSNFDLSTFDAELVAIYKERGDAIVDIEVPVVRLDEVCEAHLEPGEHVDFLKVDTEGHELAVLTGHDFERFPVRIVLAEATDARLGAIVMLLEARGFKFVTFDGLNSWFVAGHHDAEIARALGRPPSPVLDWYHPAVYERMLAERDRRIEELTASRADLTGSRRHVARLGEWLDRFARSE